MSPPIWYGGIASRIARRPTSTPMPIGPHILCAAERVEVDAERVEVARGRCGAACAPSHTTSAPTPRAIAAISATGLIVPSALDTWLNATTFVRGSTSARERVEVDAAVGRERTDRERRAALERELLPGDEVRVVLRARDDDLVARADVRAPPRASRRG